MSVVGHMHGHQESWRGHEDQLQGPEPDVRDGEVVIIAHVFAPGLQSVADKVSLLVSPHFLCSYNQDHDAKNEEDCEPDFSNTGGVFIDTPQNSLQSAPIHRLWAVCTAADAALKGFGIRRGAHLGPGRVLGGRLWS